MPLNPVLYILGILLSLLALAMLIPAGLDFYDGHDNWSAFLAAASITMFFGLGLLLSTRLDGVHQFKTGFFVDELCLDQHRSFWCFAVFAS
jgi:Trk-type K+ transport system membrane component